MPGTLVAGDLIDAARDEHPTFNANRHPAPVLLRMLSRYQKTLFGKVIRADSTKDVEAFDQAMPLPVFENGIAIPTYRYPMGVLVETARRQRFHPIELVSWEVSGTYRHAAYLLNGILFLAGHARDWVDISTVRFLYVPTTPPLAMDVKTILTLLPDEAEPVLVAFLALKMATRGGADDGQAKPDPASFAGAWTLEEDRFLDEMVRDTQAVTGRVKDVFGMLLPFLLPAALAFGLAAGAAIAPARVAGANVEVTAPQRMSVNTVRLPAVTRRDAGPAYNDVHAAGDGLHVPRVQASGVPAQMIDMKAGGDRTAEIFVGPTVQENDADHPANALGASWVALGRLRTRPRPTSAIAVLKSQRLESSVDRHLGNLGQPSHGVEYSELGESV